MKAEVFASSGRAKKGLMKNGKLPHHEHGRGVDLEKFTRFDDKDLKFQAILDGEVNKFLVLKQMKKVASK